MASAHFVTFAVPVIVRPCQSDEQRGARRERALDGRAGRGAVEDESDGHVGRVELAGERGRLADRAGSPPARGELSISRPSMLITYALRSVLL